MDDNENIDHENEADWGEPSEIHDIESDEATISAPDVQNSDKVVPDDLIEVTGSVTANWRGTSGCCSQSRIDSEMQAAFNRFIQQQKAAHPSLIYVRASLGAGKGQCRKWKDWPNGRRCNGSMTAPATAYFRNAS